MTLQLEHMLAGVRMRRGKVQRDPAVERRAMRVDERHVARVARREPLPAQRVAQCLRGRLAAAPERHADDADAAPAGGSGNGDDRIGIGSEHGSRMNLVSGR